MEISKKYIKNCPNCGEIQSYSTKYRLQNSINENWVCNKCSSVHQKKNYSSEIINKILSLYNEGVSFTKISLELKITKNTVKRILIDKNVWVENRDKVKKIFSVEEINDIIEKYNKGNSLKKISKIYNVSVTPIKRILNENTKLRKGFSDGKKIELSEEQISLIKKLYLEEYKSSEEIANELKLTKYFVCKFLTNTSYRRNTSEGVSVGLVKRFRGMKYDEYLKITNDYKKYKNDVMRITRQQPICFLGNYEKRGNSGTNDAYHLDHKYSILEGFKNSIPPEIIGNIKNLEFIPWQDNIKKRTNCSINIEEII
tara:strand:- start:3947 stop:4885 length:939 start_codon:yes stop_codon:yes gene_type:complete